MQNYPLETRTERHDGNFSDGTRGIKHTPKAKETYDRNTIAFYEKGTKTSYVQTEKTPLMFPPGMKKIAKGMYGEIYVAKYDQALDRFINRGVNEGLYSLVNKYPKAGSQVVVKIIKRKDHAWGDFIMPAVSEAYTHYKLVRRKECFAPCTVRLCPADVMPEFFMSFFIASRPKEDSYYCIVMELVTGQTLWELFRRGMGITAELFTNIEKTMATMWASGISHADMHQGNLMLDTATGKITVIDFGFAVVFPDDVWARILVLLKNYVVKGRRSIADVWDSEAGRSTSTFVNSTIKARLDTPWYYADRVTLKLLYNKLPPRERERLPEVRLRAWGCSLPPPPRPPPPPTHDELENGEIPGGRAPSPPRARARARTSPPRARARPSPPRPRARARTRASPPRARARGRTPPRR